MYMFKRILKIIGFLMLTATIYVSGAYVLPDYDTLKTPMPPPPPTRPPDIIDPVYTELGPPATIQYGKSVVLLNNADPLHAYIRYPQAGNPTDTAIYQWAQKQYDDIALHYSTGVDFSVTEFGEINIQFDSYVIDNRYAGVYLYGGYSYTSTEATVDVFTTFNIDLVEFKLLEPGDILDLENPDFVLNLLSLRLRVEHPSTDGYHEFMDESWLSYILVAPDGILVFLPHAEFLPDNFKSLTVLLPYEDLGLALKIRQDAPLPTMPTPTPVPDPPTPTPSPTPDANTGPDADDDSDADTDSDTDSDNDADTDSDNDTDSDTDTDADSDLNADEPSPTPYVPPQTGPIDMSRPLIAFTFDDGPGTYTEEFLDLFEQYGIRATFFTVGNLVNTQKAALLRAVDLDCEIAGKSWNHKNMAKMSLDDVKLQLETTTAAIFDITGTKSSIFRPPYGAVSDTMRNVSEELGYSMVKGNVDPADWNTQDPDKIYEYVIDQVKDKSIIIGHEIYESTLEAYRRIIPELLIQGYQIVTVTELIKSTNWTLTPGYLYYSGDRINTSE